MTIIFRGSTVAQDWFTNLTIGPKKLDLPECLQGDTNTILLKDVGLDVENDDPIEVHSGFYSKYVYYSIAYCSSNVLFGKPCIVTAPLTSRYTRLVYYYYQTIWTRALSTWRAI